MSAAKFGRNYHLSVSLQDGSTLTIEPPFTIEFDVTRNILTSANVCQVRIYNLSAKNRDLIRFDFSNYSTLRPIALRAGYGTNLPLIFSGNISQAWSVREGVNFITTVECFDGGFAFVQGQTPAGTNFPAGVEMESVFTTLMGNLPGTSFGDIGPSYLIGADGTPIKTTRSTSYSGNTADILNELSGGGLFIDNGRSYILSSSECRKGQVALIDSNTGLIGTPLREDNIVTFDMLFEPGLIIGQLIQLQSLTNPLVNSLNNNTGENVNGFYKTVSVKHRGMISESVCGDAITTCEFFFGPKSLNVVSTQ